MVELKTDAANQETSIALAPEQPIEGRLVDVQGQPAAGVVVRVAKLNFAAASSGPMTRRGRRASGRRPRRPTPSGRFRLLGLAPDAPATFEVEDPRFARQAFAFHVEGTAARKAQQVLRPSTTVTLRPAQALDFHVVHADDGQPVAGARIDIQSSEGRSPPTRERSPAPGPTARAARGSSPGRATGSGSASIRPRASRTFPPGSTSTGPREPCNTPSR